MPSCDESCPSPSAAAIPAEISARFESADTLGDEDRTAVIETARKALEGFLPKPGTESEAKAGKT